MADSYLQRISDVLWPAGAPGWERVWAVLDGARDRRIYGAVAGCFQENCCLYSGTLAPDLRLAAPHLVRLDRDDRLTRYLINHGWGRGWGVFLRSHAEMGELRKHFRRFLVVKDQRGRRLLFRYYDPRVLRAYLPTCLSQELETVFGPVTQYFTEGEDPETLLSFRRQEGELLTGSVTLNGEAV